MSVNGTTGLFGLLVLVLDLWSIVSVAGSDAATGTKLIWALAAIVVLSGLGILAWLPSGPRAVPRRV